ncbi:MAG: hypothetical protein WCX25_04225 [Candidatus Izemoplasmatales bacterium]
MFYFLIILGLTLFGCVTTTTSFMTTNIPTEAPIMLANPTGFLVSSEDILTWDAVDGATGYVVWINGTTFSVTETQYQLVLEENNFYDIKVKAICSSGESYYANAMYDQTFRDLNIEKKFYFSTNSNAPIIVDIGASDATVVAIKLGALVTDEVSWCTEGMDYTKTTGALTFTNAFLKTLLVGDYTYTVFTSNGFITVILTVNDNVDPYLINKSTQHYTPGEDLVLWFETFGGTVVSLNGNEITVNDYAINNGQVTIDIDYIANKFATEPQRTALILGYTILLGSDNFVGYIIIGKPVS